MSAIKPDCKLQCRCYDDSGSCDNCVAHHLNRCRYCCAHCDTDDHACLDCGKAIAKAEGRNE